WVVLASRVCPADMGSEGAGGAAAVAAKVAAAATAADEDVDADGPLVCGTCGGSIADEDLRVNGAAMKPYHSWRLSGEQFLQAKAREQGASKALSSYKAQHPREYKYKLMEIRPPHAPGSSAARRGAFQRQAAESFLEEIKQYERVSKQRYVFMLGERAFMAWFIREELYSKEEAQKKWNESVADRRVSRVTENGILKLAVQGHTTFVHETGTERSSIQKREKHGSPQAVEAAARASKRVRGAGHQLFAASGGQYFKDGAATFSSWKQCGRGRGSSCGGRASSAWSDDEGDGGDTDGGIAGEDW
ncbi:unnamed protein product, partial [Prorocentrum cordatum]